MNGPDPFPSSSRPSRNGGGCGCKIAPGVLQEILGKSNAPVPAALLVGNETSDDAAVYRLNDTQAIVATTDSSLPIVDDAHDFGAIASDQRDLRRVRDGRHAALSRLRWSACR
jgi:selenophosphate synthase